MAWETFQRQRVPLSEGPTITIQRRGTMSLNTAAHRALGSPEAVELLYDAADRRVALRKSDPSLSHSYPVRPLGRSKTVPTWLISGQAFTKYYGIDTDTARRWDAVVEGEDGSLLVIDLKQPGTEVTGNRKPDNDDAGREVANGIVQHELQERSPHG